MVGMIVPVLVMFRMHRLSFTVKQRCHHYIQFFEWVNDGFLTADNHTASAVEGSFECIQDDRDIVFHHIDVSGGLAARLCD